MVWRIRKDTQAKHSNKHNKSYTSGKAGSSDSGGGTVGSTASLILRVENVWEFARSWGKVSGMFWECFAPVR